MLKRFEEYRRYALITGFRYATISDVDQVMEKIAYNRPKNLEIQLFNARLIATWQHLYFAVLNALVAFRNNENISRSLAVETMLYASAQWQIRKAMEVVGIKTTTQEVAVVIIGEKRENIYGALPNVVKSIMAQAEDETVMELTKEKTLRIVKAFGVTSTEIRTSCKKHDLNETLIELIIERMALLATAH